LIFHFFLSLAWLGATVHFLWPDPLVLFVLFFAVGALWFTTIVVLAFQRANFGDVDLAVAGAVFPGSRLKAELRASKGFGEAREVTAALVCKRVSWREEFGTGYGKELVPLEEVVWSRQARFPAVAHGGGGLCRIEFEVPADGEVTRDKEWNSNDRGVMMQWQKPGIQWWIDVRVAAPGMRMDRSFPVTVVARPAGNITP
jgi:hypothetical protein